MIPKELIHRILLKYDFPNFVETGTQNRVTTNWAKPFFKNVYTVEINPDLFFCHEKNLRAEVEGEYSFGNKEQFDFENISFYLGDSQNVLPEIIKKLEGNTIYLLDAHYSDDTPTDKNECPVVGELDKILSNKKNNGSIIIVDDLRLFLGAPPFPHKQDNWAGIDEIFHMVHYHNEGDVNRHVTLLDDTILIYPHVIKDVIDEEWKENFHKRYK